MKQRGKRHFHLFDFSLLLSIYFLTIYSTLAAEDLLKSSVAHSGPKASTDPNAKGMKGLVVVFSDIDGTLVHYPKDTDSLSQQADNRILQLPPSATGMKGVISSHTLRKCQEIRHQGVKLVLVSGMRTSTLIKRLPYLPKADAYCCEAGGRIFYPTLPTKDSSVSPETFDGAEERHLEPYGLVEDMEWRQIMEADIAAGKNGYSWTDIGSKSVALTDRQGLLWSFARDLESKGFILDTEGYATCFRVNRKHQKMEMMEQFDDLVKGKVAHPPKLSTSINLGCVDFYPKASGKKNCCEYLARKFGGFNAMAERCVCLCDDDNDLEMALACLHAYLPEISSDSLIETMKSHPTHFTCTAKRDVKGTAATEAALSLVLERIHSSSRHER